MGAFNIGFKNGDDVSKSIQSDSQYIVSRLKGRAVETLSKADRAVVPSSGNTCYHSFSLTFEDNHNVS